MPEQILVTGANSFIGSSTIPAALAAGYGVVGAVRKSEAWTELLEVHPEWDRSRLDYVTIADYAEEGVFDAVFQEKRIDYVLHLAAPVFDVTDGELDNFEEKFERTSVAGNLQFLQAASKFGKHLKAIVGLGSINTITTGDPEDVKSRIFSHAEYLPLGREDAIRMKSQYINYCVSKKLAEETFFKYQQEQDPHFRISFIHPPFVFGPPLQKIKDMKSINLTTDIFYSFFNGSKEVTPPSFFQGYIDVRDLVELMLKALVTEAANGKRFLVGKTFVYQDVVDSLKKVPEVKGRLPKDGGEDPVFLRLDTSRTDEILPIRYRTKDQTFQDTARYIVNLEKARA